MTSITISLEICEVSSSIFFMTERIMLYAFHGESPETFSVIRLVSVMTLVDMLA